MSKQLTHVSVVRSWLLQLSVLSAVSMTRLDAETRLAAYVPMLKDRFPDAAFTSASLQHVAARAVKGFPTYGELADWLSEWWREHRPMPPRIAAPTAPPPEPPREPPTAEQIAQIEAIVAETVTALRVSALERDSRAFDEARSQPPRANYLSPEILDRINPLPDGRKRYVPTPSTDNIHQFRQPDPET